MLLSMYAPIASSFSSSSSALMVVVPPVRRTSPVTEASPTLPAGS